MGMESRTGEGNRGVRVGQVVCSLQVSTAIACFVHMDSPVHSLR